MMKSPDAMTCAPLSAVEGSVSNRPHSALNMALDINWTVLMPADARDAS